MCEHRDRSTGCCCLRSQVHISPLFMCSLGKCRCVNALNTLLLDLNKRFHQLDVSSETCDVTQASVLRADH